MLLYINIYLLKKKLKYYRFDNQESWNIIFFVIKNNFDL